MNLKEIAKLAGVSVATASRVVNGDSSVKNESAVRVRDAINSTGYIPNATGRMLRTQKSRKILVMLPTMSNQFFSRIVKGIEEKAAASDYKALIVATNFNPETELRYLDMLATRQVDGVITFFSAQSDAYLNQLALSGPLVFACESAIGGDFSYVMVDNRRAACNATQYFIDKGHKKIAIVSSNSNRQTDTLREAGYREALASGGIEFEDRYVARCENEYRSGSESCEKLMKLEEPPTAIFAVSDILAVGTVKKLLQLGVVPGKDVDVIGFDNLTITQMYTPTISTVAQPRYEIGVTATDLLFEKINNPDALSKGVILPHSLIHRETTGNKEDNE